MSHVYVTVCVSVHSKQKTEDALLHLEEELPLCGFLDKLLGHIFRIELGPELDQKWVLLPDVLSCNLSPNNRTKSQPDHCGNCKLFLALNSLLCVGQLLKLILSLTPPRISIFIKNVFQLISVIIF